MREDGDGDDGAAAAGSEVGNMDQIWDDLAEAPLDFDPDDPMVSHGPQGKCSTFQVQGRI